MKPWRALLAALLVLLFAGSGIARAAPPPGETPPCHAMAGHHAPKDKAPVQDMAAMNCCLGCLPEHAAAIATPIERPQRIAFEAADEGLEGRSPPPELGPPRSA